MSGGSWLYGLNEPPNLASHLQHLIWPQQPMEETSLRIINFVEHNGTNIFYVINYLQSLNTDYKQSTEAVNAKLTSGTAPGTHVLLAV